MRTVELRCPVGPRRLLSKLLIAGERPHVVEGNLIEFACPECAKASRMRNPKVYRILHRFNLLGELVESLEVFRGE